MTTTTHRNERMLGILPQEKLENLTCMVVGVGAIGRQVAIQLATMGVKTLVLVDPDTVGPENLGSQGFPELDLTMPKVLSVAQQVAIINQAVNVRTIEERFMPHHTALDKPDVVFCCVDNMDARGQVYNGTCLKADLFIDGRMSALTLQVITPFDRDAYEDTLFDQSEVMGDSCTSKSTFFCASLAASMMVNQMAMWLRDFPLEPMLQMNLVALQLTLDGPSKRKEAESSPSSSEGEDSAEGWTLVETASERS